MSKLVQSLGKYDYVAIRTLAKDEHCKLGKMCRKSYDWDFGEDCSTYFTKKRKLNGTSGINVSIDEYDLDDWEDADLIAELYKTVYNYGDGQKVLIAGNDAETGDDDAEIIIKGAVIIHIKDAE
jgi:hypothetical protein